jgi:hypothetical protein
MAEPAVHKKTSPEVSPPFADNSTTKRWNAEVLTGDRVALVACLADKPISNRKNRRKSRGYCGPCVPLALLIYQTQKRSWIVKAAFPAAFCEATLSQPNSRRHEPEDSGGGGKGFRKNFKCQFHARFQLVGVCSGMTLVPTYTEQKRY